MIARQFLPTAAWCACTFPLAHAEIVQRPGPSQALYDSPYYSCKKDYYVSPTGSDSNSGKSPAKPWRTLQQANDSLPGDGKAAGSCVNAAPGIYDGVVLSRGGNLASSTGYVVYRCTSLGACTVKGNAGAYGGKSFETRMTTALPPLATEPNYLMIDGFVMDGEKSSPHGVGFSSWNGNGSALLSSHHVWVLNSIIRGFGQSGIGVATSEYYYFIHNHIYGNSNLQCSWQGSGIAINVMHRVPRYTPTADDEQNPNPLLGPSFKVDGTFFHNVVEWNVIDNNALTRCGTPRNPTDTDGNGIIFDSNLIANGDTEDYTPPSLVAFNIAYNNGAGGIHLFFASNVTIANNDCYNNETDPGDGGTSRPCIDNTAGYGNSFINNIAVAVPAAGGKCWTNPLSPPFAMYNFAMLGSPAKPPYDRFHNNITEVIGTTCNGVDVSAYNGDSISCAKSVNKCATDPGWAAVGNSSPGSDTIQPVGTNFALKSDSPAIGYGEPQPYLPAQAQDAGACHRGLAVCP